MICEWSNAISGNTMLKSTDIGMQEEKDDVEPIGDSAAGNAVAYHCF